MKTFILTAGTVVLFVIANRLALHFGETRRWGVLAACGLTATLAYVLFSSLSVTRGLAVTSAVIDILIVVGSVAWGVLLRAERLTAIQSIGILLGIVATLMTLLGESGTAKPVPSRLVGTMSNHR